MSVTEGTNVVYIIHPNCAILDFFERNNHTCIFIYIFVYMVVLYFFMYFQCCLFDLI